jgi:hypothetical protein
MQFTTVFAECLSLPSAKEKHSAKYKSKKIKKNETEKNKFIGGGMHIQLVTHFFSKMHIFFSNFL